MFAGQQASGLPFSAAAAFKPYGIDAVTLELPMLLPGVWAAALHTLPASLSASFGSRFQPLNHSRIA